MKREYKVIMIIACIAATALCVLPVMSVHLSGSESCILYVRGYNLIEFSAWGCVPLFAPLLIIPVQCRSLTKQTKKLALLALLIGNIVCYVRSVAVARDWLASLDSSLIAYHPGLLLIPIVFWICIAISWFFSFWVIWKIKGAHLCQWGRAAGVWTD